MNRTYDDTMFRENFEHSYTWLNGFMRNSRRYSNCYAMFDPATNRNWTYAELDKETNRFAHALRADGIEKNDVVLGILMNCPEFVFSYIGPRKIGAIYNPTNFNLSSGEMALLIEHNKPKVVIYSAEVKDMTCKALEMSKFKPLRVIIADNLKNIPVPDGHISYEDYISNKSEEMPEMDFTPHIYDEVIRMCTSGTTSLPKSVPINDINEVLTAHDFIMHFEMNRKSVSMNLTPWFH
ncbi:MAG: AMP-binding protein, partial [Lachnospiraceae bacterium]|nr:AMP-binding protein [Lachnospiraceae bacterium]